MLAGSEALAERDRLLSELAGQVDQAQARAGRAAALPDIPPAILLGGALRAIGFRCAAAALTLDDARGADRLGRFLSSPARVRRKRSAFACRRPTRGKGIGAAAMAPAPLPRGRHRLPSELVVRSATRTDPLRHGRGDPRERLREHDRRRIVATAGVSREVFYSHFRSRADAFVATHKLVFEQLMATAAGSFFASAGLWPARVWDAWTAATEFVVGTPSLRLFRVRRIYALGPSINKRTDDAVLAFTVFLRSDQRQDTPALEPPASAFTAIAATVIETISAYIRSDRSAELFALMPLMTYMILAPFLGADAAHEFVQRKARELTLEGAVGAPSSRGVVAGAGRRKAD